MQKDMILSGVWAWFQDKIDRDEETLIIYTDRNQEL